MQLYSKLAEAIAFFDLNLTLPSKRWKLTSRNTWSISTVSTWMMSRGRAHLVNFGETLLAQLGEVLIVPYSTFSLLDNADFVFPTIEGPEGQAVQLTRDLWSSLGKYGPPCTT